MEQHFKVFWGTIPQPTSAGDIMVCHQFNRSSLPTETILRGFGVDLAYRQ